MSHNSQDTAVNGQIKEDAVHTSGGVGGVLTTRPFATLWLDAEFIMLSEVSQANTVTMSPVCGIKQEYWGRGRLLEHRATESSRAVLRHSQLRPPPHGPPWSPRGGSVATLCFLHGEHTFTSL